MKILVFADFHGSVDILNAAIEISRRETPDKTVVCGDLFGWSHPQEVATLVQKLEGVLYLIKGNNDFSTAVGYLPYAMDESAIMYHFSRKLFFTHGDRYNALRIPPILSEGDVLVHGHTHVGRLQVVNGLYVLNVGSLARARDGVPSYIVLDELGATLKHADGEILQEIRWI
ncbi:MAG: YfcE family phosphodiesterase [Clostridiales bacterium]|nr:YfcE family phosphodiesterase [Clostridiales bacterium]